MSTLKQSSTLRTASHVTSTNGITSTCRNKDSHRQISFTLVLVVFMFFFLVCPSELLHFYELILPHNIMCTDDTASTSHDVRTGLLYMCNILQAVNFSSNFLLYCLVSGHFRRSMVIMVQQIAVCLHIKSAHSLRSIRRDGSASSMGRTLSTKNSTVTHL